MREQFAIELQLLEQQFLTLGHCVLEAASKAMLALSAKDQDMAEHIIAGDKMINQFQVDIELACARILALQQPQVTDLRLVITIMSACSDLERMGDHMAGVSKSILHLRAADAIAEIEEGLHEVGQKALKMLDQLLDSFPKHAAKDALAIAKQDEAIDALYYSLSKEVINLMKVQEASIRNGTEYLKILGHLERFGDYIATICERMVYLETGELIELN
ncbi:phosphate signaling complex protein PhoU [Streptococcus halichoeri]|uniref:phosphate signaling complex protein PhoU n=1 Tax=Streptococcus halichoeri TaxID=254785 RepID=UPI00135CA854|nr:phosphate signaling complex protein PhoU [Streptococcus halichoeri]